MTKWELIRAFQSRTARIAVAASTVRGRGNAGVVAGSRRFLRELDLRAFGRTRSGSFTAALDRSTEALRDSLPKGAQHWGLARKVLNIFLRDCLYTTYLDAEHGLRGNEAHFELPLDAITARHLKRAAGRGALPPWPGVRHLTPEMNAVFQAAAASRARSLGTSRVHLDAIWWSVSRDAIQ